MGLAEIGQPENAAVLTAIRKRDIVAGWFTPGGGEPISSILNDLKQFEHVNIIDYMPYSPNLDLVALRQKLIQYSGVYEIVLQINAAHNLPGNEQNVNVHFVGVAGLDSAQGYFVLNGDDIQALKGLQTYPGRWITWGQIVSAQPSGLLVFDKGKTTMVPSGWTWDGSKLTAPNGNVVTLGFAEFVLNHTPAWPSALQPVDTDHSFIDHNGIKHDVQTFAEQLDFNSANNGITEVGGNSLASTTASSTPDVTVITAVNTALASLSALQSAVNSVVGDLSTLVADLAQVKTAQDNDTV